MHAQAIVTKILNARVPAMHARRRQALCAAVASVLRGQCLAVTALGRGLSGETDEKHRIKRADRVLSNPHLQRDCPAIYATVGRWLVGTCARPVIAVDWSDLDGAGRHFLLRASLITQGRALTLYEEVHTLAGKDKRRTHQRFLQHLRALLPDGCRPIIVTDAGFRTPWFRHVLAVGWDYVGRVRNRHLVRQTPDQAWCDAKRLYANASRQPTDLGPFELTRANPLCTRLVAVRKPPRGRHCFTLAGQRARAKRAEQHARREREPWLLVTSLAADAVNAKRVVKLYAGRMQIEEAFRDLKSTRFGLGFENARSTQPQRIAILLLIAMLALLVAWLIGMSVELSNQQRRFQANTERLRRVLSTIYLGRRALHDPRLAFPSHLLIAATAQLARLVEQASHEN